MRVFVNGQSTEINPSATVNDLIVQLDLLGKRIAVERNGQIIPKSTYGVASLHEDDTLEIVIAVGGG